jgi:hypothetical protein
MTVPNAVPPSERPSVENHPIVPWNVPPFPVAAKRTKHAAIRNVPLERPEAGMHRVLHSISCRSVPLAPLEEVLARIRAIAGAIGLDADAMPAIIEADYQDIADEANGESDGSS